MTDPTATPGSGDFALETFVPFQLSVLSNIIGEGISHAYRRPYGLSVTEWRVLAIVGRFPGLTASEVMARGAMDKVAVSRAVNKLLERGLRNLYVPAARLYHHVIGRAQRIRPCVAKTADRAIDQTRKPLV